MAEACYAPYIAGIPHDLRSVTKSVVSTLTAIALQRGLLDSVDHPVLDLFPDKKISNVDDNKRAMTVQTLLDMTSGIDWQEKYYTRDETIMRMYRSPDRTEFGLSQTGSGKRTTAFHVRRDKAAFSSGCKAHPAIAPAGSNRGRHGGDEMSEAPG